MQAESTGKHLALRLPGRIFQQLIPLADLHADGEDQDIADAISRARVKRRGGGYSVVIPLDPEQVIRLAYWISDGAPKELRDYRDAMREQAKVVLDP